MSNLRLINETTASSVSSVSITDVFSADFDIYKITILQDTGAGNSVKTQLINSSGSTITSSNYTYAQYQMRSNTSFSDADRLTSTDSMRLFLQGTDDSGTTMYIFNPFSSSSYTFGLAQQSLYYGGAGIPTMTMKTIGALKLPTSCTGIKFTPITPNFTDFDCKIYGLRVD
jgi:hypothetical protein